MHVKKLVTATFLLGAAAYGLNWDNALIMGTTPGGKMFYAPGRFSGDASKVYAEAKISRTTYSAIIGNELCPVSKQTAIQLALALKLSRREADAFLKAAGFAFSPAILEDIIVCACISANVFNIDDVNSLLTSYGSTPFAAQGSGDCCLHLGDIWK